MECLIDRRGRWILKDYASAPRGRKRDGRSVQVAKSGGKKQVSIDRYDRNKRERGKIKYIVEDQAMMFIPYEDERNGDLKVRVA